MTNTSHYTRDDIHELAEKFADAAVEELRFDHTKGVQAMVWNPAMDAAKLAINSLEAFLMTIPAHTRRRFVERVNDALVPSRQYH